MSFSVLMVALGGLAALATASSAALSVIARRIDVLRPKKKEAEQKERDYRAEIRLRQVQLILSHEVDKNILFRVASGALIFGQFVVGGILASSFVTKSLGENVIGGLGLVVLAASLVSRHFRPDMLRRVSSEKLRRLKGLKRRLEDDLYVATKGNLTDARLIEIRLFASKALEEIENEEFEGARNERERD